MTQGPSKRALGIDFGGTSVKLAVVNDLGEIEKRAVFSTAESAIPAAWLDAVEVACKEMGLERESVRDALVGIGVGAPGFVDYTAGHVHDLTNVRGWKDVQLRGLIEERFRIPAYIDNDVNAMAAGECAFGAGRDYSHAVFVTLGTGVGGGLLVDGRIFRGAHSMAGEIGHMSVQLDGVKSPQGIGGLEQYVGNRRLADKAKRAIKRGTKSLIVDLVDGDLNAISPKVIATAARKGDELALGVFDFAAKCLASAFASLIYLIQPQAIIVGGGVAQSGKVLFDPLQAHLKERLSPVFYERVEIKMAKLGNDAGVIGSASLAMR
ncbi:MAG: ROK family protein [Verrucomicrobia bacterium]|nr:ROK family protein [Verrucomicrobiota bacterium]